MNDVVVIYSGGMDSFTLLHYAHHAGLLHSALSFDYGQKHSKELLYAKKVCEDYAILHTVVDLRGITHLLGGSALTDKVPMPEGHYAEENMRLTVVPNRNMIMLSVAIAYAVSNNLKEVWFGAHGGDHDVYPDCRPVFVEGIDALAQIANWQPVRVRAPFSSLDKAGILKVGDAYHLDYASTWTCYQGGDIACGRCGSCQERLAAFYEINQRDPLEYATRELIAKVST